MDTIIAASGPSRFPRSIYGHFNGLVVSEYLRRFSANGDCEPEGFASTTLSDESQIVESGNLIFNVSNIIP
jgi:hypothetical protein